MPGLVDERLTKQGIKLPGAATPAANYIPYTVAGNIVFVSGQITMRDGELQFLGRLGDDMDVDTGYEAARLCGLNLIAQLKVACDGNLDRVKQVVKLGGFVNSMPEFTDQPKVINGASDLMVTVFGKPRGQHARFAVGATSLPLGVAVEVDGIFEID
tara:strand:- start:40 stop:510 length:471 start_codon:yes stop_codon:yes gene_type:complete